MIKKPRRKNKKDSREKQFEAEFGWEFTPSQGLSKDEHQYNELLKRNYSYDDKLYEINKEEPRPVKITESQDKELEELIEAAKRALDR